MNIIASVFLWYVAFFAGMYQTQPLFRTSTGSITFKSDAPLETIIAKSDALKGIIDVEQGTFAFSVPIRSFAGFNSKLQMEHFNENYMETERYPNATFSGKLIETLDFKKDSTYTIRAKGAFVIHGKKVERLIRVKVTTGKNSVIVSSSFVIALSDHDISIPRIVQQKISPEIDVEVNAELLPVKP